MIELSRHIESLLLKHDCVIVPELGGFVTQHVPARRVADECLFLPPYRSVSFNSQLTHNDGLLVQSYMQAYDTTFPEAVRIIDEAVLQLKQCLARDGEYTLNGIGRLRLESDGRYHFEPCEAGVISPELYGLDSFILHEIEHNEETAAEEKKPARRIRNPFRRLKPMMKHGEKTYTIRINRELVNYAAAAVVALIVYVAWATPLSDNPNQGNQTASMAYEKLFGTINTPSTEATAETAAEAPATKVLNVATEAPTKSPTAEAVPTATSEQATAAEAKANFSIVMASSVTQKNAEKFAAELSKDGYPQARAYHRGKMVRVLLGSYNTKEEAQKALRNYRSNDLFSTAWVISLK